MNNHLSPSSAGRSLRSLGSPHKRRPTVTGLAALVALVFVLLALGFSPAMAVEPSEILDDPVLEERAREISKGLRCVVCQNQSIDGSNADLARDMRVLVRERLLAGDSNIQVTDYMVSRYGDFVLLNPPFKAATYALWLGPLLIIGLGLFVVVVFYRRRGSTDVVEAVPVALSDEESRRLEALMKDES
ncbi:MAG: cytochrome c-type biogenesis protein CcmH [Rhodospirillaceae bacterium]|jgi:cytochrome c-type biogenesis protein CcmH|nr:cytochrome c-type biogenesis protein CcmH [Rhodospirillaceae bacterium]MBT5243714.1 cytochrome c-type biogenesis protein CcmH [Rhodospirillaceae bacterium]MBT5563811.1 cytochrome c-type biogenesis protein CcmH [Rhodospirillaceae bacterium]MBT6241700.1 cytochrome c-type biogenesis protein CcmH [Rhodospirillaceae bacterium]MBT7138190.1 cytochrome c-type biogenesis protein CcmH [Rhodospirillaceae bacterium]